MLKSQHVKLLDPRTRSDSLVEDLLRALEIATARMKLVQEIPFPQPCIVGHAAAAVAAESALKGAADGVGVGAEGETAVEVCVHGEGVRDDVVTRELALIVVPVVAGEDDVSHDTPQAIIDPEPGLVPGV